MNDRSTPNSASEMDKAEGERVDTNHTGEPPAEKRVRNNDTDAAPDERNPVLPSDDASLRTEM